MVELNIKHIGEESILDAVLLLYVITVKNALKPGHCWEDRDIHLWVIAVSMLQLSHLPKKLPISCLVLNGVVRRLSGEIEFEAQWRSLCYYCSHSLL